MCVTRVVGQWKPLLNADTLQPVVCCCVCVVDHAASAYADAIEVTASEAAYGESQFNAAAITEYRYPFF